MLESKSVNKSPRQESQEIYVDSTEPIQRRKRKKFTVFNYKRHSDGSLEKKKSVIYKDYYPKNSKIFDKNVNPKMQYYVGSAAAIKKVLQRGQHQVSLKNDGSIELNLKKHLNKFENTNNILNN